MVSMTQEEQIPVPGMVVIASGIAITYEWIELHAKSAKGSS